MSFHFIRIHLVTFALAVFCPLVSLCARAGEGADADESDAANRAAALKLFETHVRPTFLDQCIRCHGPKKQQGGLRLDSREWLMKGGDSGDAIKAGHPEDSLLITAIRYDDPGLEMPPKGRLPDVAIKALQDWVSMGAIDPRDAKADESHSDKAPTIAEGREFWSFQSVADPKPPNVRQSEWPSTSIDHFVLAELEAAGLFPTQQANRENLIRRAYYDLIGLPPTPDEIIDFVDDDSDDAFERLVERLLDSPHFGERWGRHWLDVVRFAESSGGGRTLLFPNAWRYRDYVIDAFNQDMPYDQFVSEQLAGDLLSTDLSREQWQDKRRMMTATAYLLLGPTNYELQDKDILEMDVVDEQIDTIGKSFLGMTIGCARCHDHKFDPIPAEDYYALAGILKSTKAMIHSNVSTWNKVSLPVPPELESKFVEQEKAIEKIEERIQETRKSIKRLGGKNAKNPKPRGDRNIPSGKIVGIVIDDEQAELVGAWTPSTSVPRFVDEKYIHDGTAGKGTKKAIYRPKLQVPGVYDIRVSYAPMTNRSTRVPVHVFHAGGESVVTINQKELPEIEDAFTSVGVYELDPARDPRIVISNEGTDDGVVIADAVVLVPSKLAPLPRPDQVDIPENISFIVQDPRKLPGIVVDNTDAKLVGLWKHSVHTPPFVGAGYIHDDKKLKGEKSATFSPDLPKSGKYEVRVSHNTNVRRANHVPIIVRHAGGSTTIHIDEGDEAPINKLFRSLGTFEFEQGTSGSVTFTTTGTEGKNVIVDAVQFIPVEATEALDAQLSGLKKELKGLEDRLKQLRASGLARPVGMVTADDDDAGDIHLAIRGVVHNKGPLVRRGVMQVAADKPRPQIADGESGRRELAEWIANENNPLTARVMVNRVWYWLIGRGIVGSVDNFGTMGDQPTHPKLLDHLATSFIENDWSVKQLIHAIMTSRTYQMATHDRAECEAVDPDNRLLWRMNRKRMRAEDIRDTLLFVGGQLDEDTGGSNIKNGTKSEYGYKFTSTRRSVYVPVFRNTLPEIFEVFDFADPNIQRGRRTSSTIASQALLLMNHPFVTKQSRLAAERLQASEPKSVSEAIEQAYLQVIGRRPTDQETELAAGFVGDGSETARWTMLFQTLFECVDFRYLN